MINKKISDFLAIHFKIFIVFEGTDKSGKDT